MSRKHILYFLQYEIIMYLNFSCLLFPISIYKYNSNFIYPSSSICVSNLLYFFFLMMCFYPLSLLIYSFPSICSNLSILRCFVCPLSFYLYVSIPLSYRLLHLCTISISVLMLLFNHSIIVSTSSIHLLV